MTNKLYNDLIIKFTLHKIRTIPGKIVDELFKGTITMNTQK